MLWLADINECADENTRHCEGICTNTPGGYFCTCPIGTYDDGEQDGIRCIPSPKDNKELPLIQVTVGNSLLICIKNDSQVGGCCHLETFKGGLPHYLDVWLD